MTFLANENFPLFSIELLRDKLYEVISIKEKYQGVSDITVFQLAKEMNSIILTFDKDYGEIIFRNEIVDPPPVVFFRHKGFDPLFAAQTLITMIESEEFELTGYFTVVEQTNIRQRKL